MAADPSPSKAAVSERASSLKVFESGWNLHHRVLICDLNRLSDIPLIAGKNPWPILHRISSKRVLVHFTAASFICVHFCDVFSIRRNPFRRNWILQNSFRRNPIRRNVNPNPKP